MQKRTTRLLCALLVCLLCIGAVIPAMGYAADATGNPSGTGDDVSSDFSITT